MNTISSKVSAFREALYQFLHNSKFSDYLIGAMYAKIAADLVFTLYVTVKIMSCGIFDDTLGLSIIWCLSCGLMLIDARIVDTLQERKVEEDCPTQLPSEYDY